MKRTLFLLSVSFVSLLSVAFAQEEAPKYNFGSMQAVKEFSISPGDEITTKLYFYNIYGNRITHILLSIGEAPENWEVSIKPEAMNVTVKVSGISVSVFENLYVEPSQAVEEAPEKVPEGIEYILSSVGYIPAKPVEIEIKVPEDEELGKEFNISIDASAFWLGQTGAIAITQGRSFNYKATTKAKEFKEEIVEKPKSKVLIPKKTKEEIKKELVENTKLKTTLEKIIGKKMNEEAIENLAKISAEISEDLEMSRELSSEKGRSTLTLKLKYESKKKPEKLIIHDSIPEKFANSSDEITVSAPGAFVETLEEYPEYLFTYSELTPKKELEINYMVDKEVGSEVLDEIEAPNIYMQEEEPEKLETTTIPEVTTTLKEEPERVTTMNILVIGLIVIVLVGLVYLLFVRGKK